MIWQMCCVTSSTVREIESCNYGSRRIQGAAPGAARTHQLSKSEALCIRAGLKSQRHTKTFQEYAAVSWFLTFSVNSAGP